MILWVVAGVLGASGTSALPCQTFEAGAGLGATFYKGTTGGTEGAGALDVVGAYSVSQCDRLAARVEIQLSTTTRGPPWGRGVDAVEVSSFGFDVSLLMGGTFAVWKPLGVALLLGPDVKTQRVRIQIRDSQTSTWETRILGRVVGGPFIDVNPWQFSLRLGWSAPRGDGVSAVLGATRRF